MVRYDRLRLTGLAATIAFSAIACGGSSSPAAPSVPTTAPLHVGIDVSTCYLIGTVAVSVDGQLVGSALPGSAGVTSQVTLGGHTVSGIGLTLDRTFQTTWAPTTVTVPAAGFNFTMYCQANRGYSVTRADGRN
jgi:hypothetical protein